ncbi:MAG TPA: SMP-30/gluconolactonase/LRE family protein, partial [Solirubrobacterales bacterium]|nr:SMP-30/gluconolactonase/LRE family protein [Solirubrobacterales bacterium]
MTSHAKASSAESTLRKASGLERIVRGGLSAAVASRAAGGSGAPSHRRTRLAVALALAAFLLLALAPSSMAVLIRAKTATFGPDGTASSSFGNPSQLAFNQANDKLYVLASGSSTIHAFDVPAITPSGAPFPLPVASASGEPDLDSDNTVAPSPTAANLYYESESTQTVYGFDSSGAALGAPFPIEPSDPKDLTGVAVDPSGYVWVSDWSTEKVRKYDPATGTEVGSVDTSTVASGRPAHLAFDSNGDMYLAFYFGPLYKFTAASGYAAGSATLIDSTTTPAVDVDRTTHRVYALHSGKVSVRDTSGTLLYEFAGGFSGQRAGVAVDEGADIVYVSDSTNGKMYAYGPAANYSDATASPSAAKDVTDTSAAIGATITDNNQLPTSWRLELSADEGTSWSTVSSGETTGNQTNVAVSGTATGLQPKSDYRFRVVTSKGFGFTEVISAPLSFETVAPPPVVSDVGAVQVNNTSARLVGTIDPRNTDTGYVFQYGA